MDPASLLGDSAWLSRLALALADSRADADDLAQDARIAAWQKRPDVAGGRSLRPWLTKVARDLAAMRRRGDRRRAARHAAIQALPARAPARPDELLARAELHRAVVAAVLALPEPLRATVLARFVDGQSSAQIARAQGVPESTVRGRVRDGLARLRAALDAEHGGRAAWAPIALACAPGGFATTAPAAAGASPTSTSHVAVAAVAALAAAAALVVVVVALRAGASGSTDGDTSAPIASDDRAAHDRAAHDIAHDIAHDTARDGAARDDGNPRRAATTREPSIETPRPWWDLPDVALVTIAGRVVDASGAPVAGARVESFGWSRAGAHGAPEIAIADARGEFRFDNAARDATMHQLFATAPGYAAGTALADPRAPAHETDPAHVTLVVTACASRITGAITDRDGSPITGATVAATDSSLWPGGGVTTDARGQYELCLPRAAKWLFIGADGHEHVKINVPPLDGAVVRVDRVLGSGGAIRGRVVDADTGEPVPAAQVMAGGTLSAGRNTISDADGAFVLDGLAADDVWLNVWAADHLFPAQTKVHVEPGRTTDGVELAVPPAVTVRGVVRSHGVPLAGASIRFSTPSERGPVPSLRAVAGPDGRFVAVNVGRGAAIRVKVDGASAVRVAGGRGDGDVVDTRALAGDLDIDVE